MRPYKRKHQPPISAVIVEDAFRQERAVRRPAPKHAMYPRHSGNRGVARVRAPDVRAGRRYKPRRVIFLVEKCIITLWVFAQFGVVMERAEGQRGAAPP